MVAVVSRPSSEADSVLWDLMNLPPADRRDVYREFKPKDLQWVLGAAQRQLGSPYGLWIDDAQGFVEDILGEPMWSIPSRMFTELSQPKARLVVPSCFASSKTWSAARAVLWWSMVHPVGTAKTVLLAPLWRQVTHQLWPELRRSHSAADLPGVVDMSQMKMPTEKGMDYVVAYGIAAAPHNEAAVQGIHAANLLLVVDEAGGLGHVIGRNLRGLLTGDNTRLLTIGNPPTDEERSWFERLSEEPSSTVLRISAFDTPNLTGEQVARCGSCPLDVPAHPLSDHLVDREWVDDTIRVHGDDSPFVQAKVYARWVKTTQSVCIPASWVDAAKIPKATEHVPGSWVRLGVDVASGGGDELVVARLVGDQATIEHVSAGPDNANPVHVAGVILHQILEAEALARSLQSEAPVRVKVDAIGVGWGVAGLLEEWGREGRHSAQIVKIVVSERPGSDPEAATLRPRNKRAEMWLSGRAMLMPDENGYTRVRLVVDDKTATQLSLPKMQTDSAGFTVIESKDAMRNRGVQSPDRAEAFLLSVYEPTRLGGRRKVRILASSGR